MGNRQTDHVGPRGLEGPQNKLTFFFQLPSTESFGQIKGKKYLGYFGDRKNWKDLLWLLSLHEQILAYLCFESDISGRQVNMGTE